MLIILGVLGAVLASYVIWLVLRPNFRFSIVLDGWLPDGFEFLVAMLCIARGFIRQSGRIVSVTLGCGLLSWCLGDTAWTVQSLVGSTKITNLLLAAFWLGFYPLAYVALVLFMRGKIRALSTPTWLDGIIAALGTAAVCAAFAFHGSASAVSSNALTEATNIAFPIGDLLLFALVAGGAALLSGRSTTPWIVLAAACALNCFGDTFNLFQSYDGPLRLDAIFHALAWPAAGLLMTVAIWLRPHPSDLVAHQRSTGFLLPGVAASAGLVVLIVGTIEAVNRIALGLAIGSLVAAGMRLVWTARGLRTLTEQRHRQSMTDQLTGIGNRRYLFDLFDAFFLDQTNPESARRRLVFLFIDLNRFKEINDSFGHLAGDALLKQLGPRLMRSLRNSDVLVRFGGDEFGVVLMDADVDHAATVAEHISASLQEPFDLDGLSVAISASIGIATVPTDATDVSGLLECADVAMYRSKLGGSAFAFYDRNVDTANQWRLADELRLGIEQQQFVIHYQPQLSLRTDEIAGVEALVRWQHPTLGMLAPSTFIPLAEDAGLMPLLTPLLIDAALTQGALWRDAGHYLSISVNISATNLLDEGFTEIIRGLLERHRFPASSLVLEITETSVIANFEESRSVIDALAELGVVLSIDDFGAGFTSLSYLSALAVRELKLDCKLITDLDAESLERDRELVRSTIDLGHAQGLRVVAEGVEDRSTLELLREQRCDLAQGYFIGRPMPADKLAIQLGLVPSQRQRDQTIELEMATPRS